MLHPLHTTPPAHSCVPRVPKARNEQQEWQETRGDGGKKNYAEANEAHEKGFFDRC